MKCTEITPIRPIRRGLVLALAATSLASYVAHATPYATCLTNNNGVVSFRLNEAADAVKVLWNSGASSANLGARAKGLTVTNLGVSGTFYVQVAKVGSNAFSTNSPVAFNSPRSVAVNYNPKSPNFGRVFVGNTAAGTKGWGIYALQSDLTDIFGGARTGGIAFGAGGSAPWRLTIGEDDDLLYAADWTDNNGNLYVTDQDVTTNQYALKQLGPCLDGSLNAATDAANPPGYGNNHGSIAAVAVFGTTNQGNLTILTVDEDLQDDRANKTPTQMNSVWRYDVGSGAFPYTDFHTNRLVTPNINYVSNVEGLSHGTNGYLYFCQSRSNGGEPGVYLVTNILTAFQYGWNNVNVWNSLTATRALLGSTAVDIFVASPSVSVSRDGRWLATINANNNTVTIARLTNGVPDLTRRIQYTGFGTAASGRDLAWDAADNLYIASSGLLMVNSLNLGLTATNTTGSDGTFNAYVPSVVNVLATTNTAHRTDVPGNFTLYRDGDLSVPLTVSFTLTGTAVKGTDYNAPTSVTFPAGAANVDLPIVPLPSTKPVAPLTVIITLTVNPTYNLFEARTATVVITDNQTPVLSLTRNYTSMYEREPTDFIRFTINRSLGETNVGLNVPITNAGNATLWTDYSGPTYVYVAPGVVSQTVDFNPVANNTVEGPLNIILGLDVSGLGDYTLTNSTGAFTIIDSDLAPETVLWSDDFDAYNGTLQPNQVPAGWSYKFAATNALQDFSFTFGYDYSQKGVPAAPGGYSTIGLRATVNKYDTTPSAAALNFYPAGKSFSGNYALRFNMLLVTGTSNAPEHAIFGLDHSGTKTNWNRSGGVLQNNAATNQDGLWCSVSSANNSGWDYTLWTAGTGASTSPGILTNRTGNPAAGMNQVFKNNGLAVGPHAVTGAPGCAYNGALNWVDVEVAQTANMVVLRLDNQVILATTNLTPFTSGNVMLGYNDMLDNTGDSNNACVYYDNVRVVRIAAPIISTQPVSTTAPIGSPANFSVVASTTTGVINYQWFCNNAPVVGATSATLSIASVAAANYGTYWVTVDDGNYPVRSDAVTLTPPALPVIIIPPAPIAAAAGSLTNFSVVASTTSGVTNYQWQFNSANLSGTTTNPFYLTVRSTNYGSYRVVVSDGYYYVTSSVAALTPPLPFINVPPANRAALVGSAPSFSVIATTYSGVTNYQWMYYGTNLAGATTATLARPGVQPVSFGGPYTVRVNDGTTSITSSPPVTLTVAVAPTNTAPVVAGTGYTFSFGTEVGPGYVVDYKPALTNATWTALSTNAGTGGFLTVTNAMTGDQGYYRIRLQ